MAIATIFFIWLGTILPTNYQQTYQQCLDNYGQCRLIGLQEEAELISKFNMSNSQHTLIQRADLLRLLVLQEHGGIYMDFETQVKDWNFLKMLNCEGQTYFGEDQGEALFNREYQVSNWFICSGKNSSEMQRLIDNIDRSYFCNGPDCYAGSTFLRNNNAKIINQLYPFVKSCREYPQICRSQESHNLQAVGSKCFKFASGVVVLCIVVWSSAFLYFLRKKGVQISILYAQIRSDMKASNAESTKI